MFEFLQKLFTPFMVVHADLAGDITNGINGIINLGKSVMNPILGLGIFACAVYLIGFGGDDQVIRKVKKALICMIAGMIVINNIDSIIAFLSGLGAA